MKQQQLFPSPGGAEFSECRRYRFALWRIWDENKPLVMFIGLNPSTANETTPDPTIQSVERISRFNGYGGFYMMNCFPLVSSEPAALKDMQVNWNNDGPDLENLQWLFETRRKCKDVVYAWGNFKIVKDMGRDKDIKKAFPGGLVIGTNTNGSPKHPLFQSGETTLMPLK